MSSEYIDYVKQTAWKYPKLMAGPIMKHANSQSHFTMQLIVFIDSINDFITV